MQKRRPNKNEYGPYYQGYISQVEGEDVLPLLEQNKNAIAEFLRNIPVDKWKYKYAPGKWTPKDIVLHLIDGERVFSYRALRISRGGTTPLPGFDQDIFAENARANERTPESLIKEYEDVRESTLHIFRNMTDNDANRIGQASGYPASPLAIAYILVGHENHHVRILKERYL
jgi:hypothetical protein